MKINPFELGLDGFRFWRRHSLGKKLVAKVAPKFAARREAKRKAKRGLPAVQESTHMGKYSKAIGAIVGGLVMIVVIRFPFLAPIIPPGFADQAAVWIGALAGTFFAPKNAA